MIVVDEAVLSLTGYQFPNPIDAFYTQRGADTRDYYLRAYVKLAKPDAGASSRRRRGAGRVGCGGSGARPSADARSAMAPPSRRADPMARRRRRQDGAKKARQAARRRRTDTRSAATLGDAERSEQPTDSRRTPIAIRSNFNPLAAFSPAVKTDADGKATVDVKMPDNLTRYRIIAIAVAGDKQFGKGESAITARLPLMVRPSPPRFLNFGDTFQLPVVVQNQTDAPMTVQASRCARRTPQLTDGAGREVTRAGERSRRGPVPGGRRAWRAPRGSRSSASSGDGAATPPSSRCRCGRRRPPRRSRPTA